jgi:putative hemolysin
MNALINDLSEDPILWIIIIGLIILGAFFSASETALAAADKIRLKVKADEGNKSAKLAVNYIEKFDQSVITVVVGNNITTVLISSLATLFFVAMFGVGIGGLLATLIATTLTYIFSETIPKSIAKSNPNQMVLFSVYILRFFYFLLYPIIISLHWLNNLLIKLLRRKEEPGLTEQDFSNIIEEAEETGAIAEEDSELIQMAMDFTETVVKDVFTPIKKVKGINITGLTKESLHKILIDTNYSRLPVYKDKITNIIGVLHVRTYFKKMRDNPNLDIFEAIAQPYFAPIKIGLDELFEGFRTYKTHIAIVIDRKQKVIGMVTMEDLLEEIVGDIEELKPSKEKTNHAS